MQNHIAGKVIVVTGAASGFGRLICGKCAALGARIVGIDVNAEALREMTEAIEQAGGVAMARIADVRNLAEMKAAAGKAVETFGALDVMINNAGIMPLAFFSDHLAAADAWDRCIDINFKGVLNGILAVHDQMIAQGHGHVVNMSSIYGNFPVTGGAVYGATKAAVNFLSESLRMESQGKIKVTIVKPTGVPATQIGAGVINRMAGMGILGQNAGAYLERVQAIIGGNPQPGETDPGDIRYAILSPDHIADQVVQVVNQPWGISIGEITIRASGDAYLR
jgi:NADP-dependent 3-hydroxy acid dehydrogenase YdfG